MTAPVTCIGRCTIHGEHLSECVGIRNHKGKAVECVGCLPQPAARGVLCWSCEAKVAELWELLPDLVPHLRSVERGPIPDGPPVFAAPGSRVIIPASWLAADTLWETMHELIVTLSNQLGKVEPTWAGGTTMRGFGSRDGIDTVMQNVWLAVFVLVSHLDVLHETPETARRLLRLVRAAQSALASFPLEERARMVEYVRCRSCSLVQLEWRPPLSHAEPITVRCRACGTVYDPQMVTWDMQQLREQYERALQVVA